MTDSDMLRHFAPKAVKEVKNKADYGLVKDDLKDYILWTHQADIVTSYIDNI